MGLGDVEWKWAIDHMEWRFGSMWHDPLQTRSMSPPSHDMIESIYSDLMYNTLLPRMKVSA
jgi:hypothetical protein